MNAHFIQIHLLNMYVKYVDHPACLNHMVLDNLFCSVLLKKKLQKKH